MLTCFAPSGLSFLDLSFCLSLSHFSFRSLSSCCHCVSFQLVSLPLILLSFPCVSCVFPSFPGISFYPSIPCSFLPWYILFPFIWLSLAFSFFPSMFILLAIIFLYIAFYGYSMQYYII